jgi:hypothetical protein
MSWCLTMSLRAGPNKANAGSQQIQNALPPWPIQAHDRLGLALWVERLMSNNNGVRTFHLYSEPSGREHLFPQDLSWLLHAGKLLGPAFDHPRLIAPWTIGVEIAGQIAQHPCVSPQPRHPLDAMPEPSAP